MNPRSPSPRVGFVRLLLLPGFVVFAGAALGATNFYEPAATWAGGLDPRAQIQEIARTGTTVTVHFTGITGPFRLAQSASIANSNNVFEAIGDTVWNQSTWNQQSSLSATDASGFFRVQSPDPNYAGVEGNEPINCSYCHNSVYTNWNQTAHSRALKSLQDIGMARSTCLPCHTVGYGFSTGFQDATATPHLANVQCETCHGPAANHLANPLEDKSARPVVSPSSEICGGCHRDIHHPTYEEWTESLHANVDAEVASSMASQGEARMLACGPCHSGSVRLALLKRVSDPEAKLPSPTDAGRFGITCVVCHDPHQSPVNPADGNPNPAQLRNPTYSTDNFSYSTSTNTSFAAQYRADVQMCAQCHNLRGGRWQDTSRPPHHSPQYNLLIGQGGAVTPSYVAGHGRIAQQCTHCHAHGNEVENPSEESPNYTGHKFEPMIADWVCGECHDSGEAAAFLVEDTRDYISWRLGTVADLLRGWATNKAPVALRDKYGALAWEYNNPGTLSNAGTNKGPTTAEQGSVPDAIKQARFNLYMVLHDGSYGVHNSIYASQLITTAEDLVTAEINK